MARKPPAAYASLEMPAAEVEAPPPQAATVSPATAEPEQPSGIRGLRRRKVEKGTDLKSRAKHVMTYPSHEFYMAVKRFALESGPDVKVHDLLVEAFQEWCDKRGLKVTVRVPSRDRDITD